MARRLRPFAPHGVTARHRHQMSLGLGRVAEPAFPGRDRAAVRQKNVPTGSAAKMASRIPGTDPLAMMTDSPAAVARRAARILLRMPPVPRAALAAAGHVQDRAVDERHRVSSVARRVGARIGRRKVRPPRSAESAAGPAADW